MRRNVLTMGLVTCVLTSSAGPLFGSVPADPPRSLERPDARSPSWPWDGMRGPMTMPLPASLLTLRIDAGGEGRS